MKVTITSEERANGLFLIETWVESGRRVEYGPVDPDKAEQLAADIKGAIMAQAAEQRERLAAMVRSDEQAGFFAQKEPTWLPRKKQ